MRGEIPASSYSRGLQEAENLFSAHNPDYIDAPFYTNHDMGRSAGYYAGDQSEDQTKLSGAMNLLMSGNAFEELGMKGAGKDENKRAPMYFSSDPSFEGMCEGPADMDDVKMKFGSLQEQEKDGLSVYSYYKEAIGIRNRYPAIRKGKTENLEQYSSDTIAAFSKEFEGEKLYVFINVSGREAVIDLSEDKNISKKKIENALYTGEEKGNIKDGLLTIPGYGIILMDGK